MEKCGQCVDVLPGWNHFRSCLRSLAKHFGIAGIDCLELETHLKNNCDYIDWNQNEKSWVNLSEQTFRIRISRRCLKSSTELAIRWNTVLRDPVGWGNCPATPPVKSSRGEGRTEETGVSCRTFPSSDRDYQYVLMRKASSFPEAEWRQLPWCFFNKMVQRCPASKWFRQLDPAYHTPEQTKHGHLISNTSDCYNLYNLYISSQFSLFS